MVNWLVGLARGEMSGLDVDVDVDAIGRVRVLVYFLISDALAVGDTFSVS